MRTRSIIIALLSLITLSAYGLVQISSLQDFNFGTATLPFSALQQTDSICLYNSANPPNLIVTITGLHDAAGKFQLANGSSRLVYQVKLSNTNDTNYVTFTPGAANLRRGQRNTPLCGAPINRYANFRITIPAASFNDSLTAGTYTDTLSILIVPQ